MPSHPEYKVHVPCRMTEDETSHFNQVFAKHMDLVDGSQGTVKFPHIPPFDKNFRQRYNLMQRMRFISQRKQYSAYVYRNEIATLIQENSVSHLHCDPTPMHAGVATQIPQIVTEIDSYSSQRIFVIRATDLLCESAVRSVQKEMCLEDSPTVFAYHPLFSFNAQAESKVIFLTLSSFLHVMQAQSDLDSIVVLEDISDYIFLRERSRELSREELRRLADYVLLFSIVQKLATFSGFRFLMGSPACLNEASDSLFSSCTSALSPGVPHGAIKLQNEDNESTLRHAPICDSFVCVSEEGVDSNEEEVHSCQEVSVLSLQVHLSESYEFRESNEPAVKKLTVILTDKVARFTEIFSTDETGPLFFLPHRPLSEPEIVFLRHHNIQPWQPSENDGVQRDFSAILVELSSDFSFLETLHETFREADIGSVIFALQGGNDPYRCDASSCENARIYAPDITERAKRYGLFTARTRIQYCEMSLSDDRSAHLSLDNKEQVLKAHISDQDIRESLCYYLLMRKSLEITGNSVDCLWGSSVQNVSTAFDHASNELLLLQSVDTSGKVTKLGRFVTYLSYLTSDMHALRLIAYGSWYACPSFGIQMASLLMLHRQLRVSNYTAQPTVALIESFAEFVHSHLHGRGVVHQDFSRHAVMMHRCILVSAFYPNIAFPRRAQDQDKDAPALFDVPFRKTQYGDSSVIHFLASHGGEGESSRHENYLEMLADTPSDIRLFTSTVRCGGALCLLDKTGGYLSNLEAFYAQFFGNQTQNSTIPYAFNNYPVCDVSGRHHLYKTIAVAIFLASNVDETTDYPIQQTLGFEHATARKGSKNRRRNLQRGWIEGVSRSWASDDPKNAENPVDAESGTASAALLSTDTLAPITLCHSDEISYGTIDVDGSLRIIFQNAFARNHFAQLRGCYDLCMQSSSIYPLPLEILQVIDWSLQKCYAEETEEEEASPKSMWRRLSPEATQQPAEGEKSITVQFETNTIDDLMMEKFAHLVATLQDRSFESYCRDAVDSEEKSLMSEQLRYMLSFLDSGSDLYTSYEARLLDVLPNMPKLLAPLVKDPKESHLQSVLSRGLLKFIDDLGEDIVQQQRKRMKSELKQAKKTQHKEADGVNASAAPMKQISILSDIQDGETDQRKKSVNTNVELLHATERELEEAAPAVLVEPLPLKKATNLNLPLILAKALGEILDAKVGPTCLLSEYAHIQVPSKKVADSAMKLGSFMCLGEMVHIHKNCYIVRHKNEQLTKKLDGIRSKNIKTL